MMHPTPRICSIVLLAVGLLHAGPKSGPEGIPDSPMVFRLPSGLKVAYCRDAMLSGTEMRIDFDVSHLPQTKGSGLALSFGFRLIGEGGTAAMNFRDFSKELERLGTSPEFFEDPDSFSLRLHTDPQHLETILGFTVDLLRSPFVAPDRLYFEKELAVRRQSTLLEQPLERIQVLFVDWARGEGRGGLSPLEAIDAVEPAKVIAAQKELLRPERMKVLLAGPLPFEVVREWVESRLRDWASTSAEAETLVPRSDQGPRAATIKAPAYGNRQAFALGLAMHSGPRSASLALAGEWLAWRAAQDPRSLQNAVKAICTQGGTILPAVLGFAAAPLPNETVACRAQLQEWLHALLTNGIQPAEFELLRKALILREESRLSSAIERAQEAALADGKSTFLADLRALAPERFHTWVKEQLKLNRLQTLAIEYQAGAENPPSTSK